MTPAALLLARDGSGDAAEASTALWASIVGDPDADPAVPEEVPAAEASAALAMVARWVGEETDVDDWALREGVVRLAGHLQLSVPGVRSIDDTDFAAGENALIRSGAASVLTAWRIRRGSICG